MRVNLYQRFFFFILGLGLSFLSLISIFGLLQWDPVLKFINWATKGGIVFSFVILIILFIFSFIAFVSSLVYKENSILHIGDTSGLGSIKISLQGLRNSIKDIAQYFSEIQEIKPEIKISRSKVDLILRIKIPVGVDVNRIVSELQQRVKVYFENVLNINLEKIEVIIEDIIIPVKRGK
ncbi:MAG: alkaline shock response membrane anchor protein AmaP [Dictyoglomaceae bacterium]|nr:alkaline shock response membrane anchor protein AmaP [Dictyoglomaceae bacterium]